MRLRSRGCWLLLILTLANTACAAEPARLPRALGSDFRVVAWNVSRESIYRHTDDLVATLRAIDADLLILDEMSGKRTEADVRAVLDRIDPDKSPGWQISYGTSGDNQRAVIAVRDEVRSLPEFALLPYPAAFVELMDKVELGAEQRAHMPESLSTGIAANGAIVSLGGKRVLVVGVDLQCCGDSDDAWEEQRRWVETEEIRARLQQVLEREKVDAIIAGGDFNALRGLRPVEILQGDPEKNAHLKIAEARHRDCSRWTWDGRGTPFKSSRIDFILHDAHLRPIYGLIFDPETMGAEEVEALGLTPTQLLEVTAHRPVVVDFAWVRRRD